MSTRVSARAAAVRACAKLNLRLRILAREASGYHTVETILHRITLADDVIVTLRDPGTRAVDCDVDVGPAEHNLAYRAAVAFLSATGWNTGFSIQITKRIPAGGGLGGGSADAGATLRALNALAPSPLTPAQVLAVATPLGADVPFLTSDAPMALAWGRGERLLALDPLPKRHVVLVVPSFRVATGDAYRWVAESRAGQTGQFDALELHPWHLANWAELAPWGANDFEPVIGAHHPEIHEIIAALRKNGAMIAGMTGSGSTLYGVFDAPPPVERLQSVTGGTVLVTETAGGVDAVALTD
jgi:4-diphosphocytidyl-2-C-methyl-D-erythritol kinase